MRTIGSQTDNSDEMCPIGTQTETDEPRTTNGTQSQSNDEMGTNGSQNEQTEMRSIGSQNEEVETIDVQILPTSERQVRPLTKLEPDQQREAWFKSVQEAGGVPSGRIVRSIVEQIQERNPVPNPWKVGDVAKIVAKDDPQLRGKGGCWAVITAVGDFSCTVRVFDGECQVKPANLKELPYSSEQQDEVKSLCDRIAKIKVDDAEKPMKDFLAGLGKIQRPWLTELEEKVLKIVEET